MNFNKHNSLDKEDEVVQQYKYLYGRPSLQKKACILKVVPRSHWFPWRPPRQLHLYPLPSRTHVPPLRQGLGSHGCYYPQLEYTETNIIH